MNDRCNIKEQNGIHWCFIPGTFVGFFRIKSGHCESDKKVIYIFLLQDHGFQWHFITMYFGMMKKFNDLLKYFILKFITL